MKKIIAIAIFLILSVVGCGSPRGESPQVGDYVSVKMVDLQGNQQPNTVASFGRVTAVRGEGKSTVYTIKEDNGNSFNTTPSDMEVVKSIK